MGISKYRKKEAGQSTLEYIILVTGVIAVLIIFLNPTGGVFTQSFNKILKEGTNGMEKMSNRLFDSY